MIIGCLAAIGTTVTVGCQDGKKDRPKQYAADSRFNPEYRAVFEGWTKEDRIYKGFDCKLIAAATYKSMPFRKAYVKEYNKLYRLSEAEAEKLLRDQEDAAATYDEFFLAAYVPEKNWDDFSDKKSIWKIVLTNGAGGRRAPVEIRKLERNNVVLKHFFPYVTPWKSVYLLRFPVQQNKTEESREGAADTASLTLSVSSVLGSAEMTWDLTGLE